MDGYRNVVGVALGSFAMSFIFLGCGIALQLKGLNGGSFFCLLALPFNFIGVLASWLGKLVAQQSARLDKLEARLGEHTGT